MGNTDGTGDGAPTATLGPGIHVAPFLASNGSAVALLIGAHGELLGAGVLGPLLGERGPLPGKVEVAAPEVAVSRDLTVDGTDSHGRLIAADPAVERGLEGQCRADLSEMLDTADPVAGH